MAARVALAAVVSLAATLLAAVPDAPNRDLALGTAAEPAMPAVEGATAVAADATTRGAQVGTTLASLAVGAVAAPLMPPIAQQDSPGGPGSGAVAPQGPGGEPTEDATNSVPALDPAIPRADLRVEITAERNPVLSESFFSYAVTVTNDGPDEAENVVVSHTIPDYLSFILTNGCWLNNDMWPDCHLDEIPAGESKTYHVLVLTSPGSVGDHDFTATATSQTADPDPTNNAASFTSTINIRATWRDLSATADLAVSKVDLVDPVPALGEITYRITVANNGPSAAVDVQATEALPPGVTLVTTTGCAPGSGVPVCRLGTLAPGQVRSYDVTVTADAGTTGDITNAVHVTTRSNDPNAANDVATETTTVQSATIILEARTLPAGSTDTFTFTGDLAGEIGDGDTLQLTDLPAGTYTTTEMVPAGWGIADITCDDTASTNPSGGDPATGQVTFAVEGAETVRCVVTNAVLASVTIETNTIGSGIAGTFGFAGDLGTFDLTTTGNTVGTTPVNTAATTFDDLLPGAYAVTEDDPATAFYLTGLECADDDAGSTADVATRTASIDLDAGEHVTCTFTNSQAGSVTIDKATVGAGGTFDFSGDLGPRSVTTTGSGTATSGFAFIDGIAPGTYELTEEPNPAYSLTELGCLDGDNQTTTDLATATATIDLDPGENVMCGFVNTELGTIVVEKQTLPDGDPQTFSFTGDVAGSIADGETISLAVLPGTYSATETVPAGWDLTDITCDDNASATPSTGNTTTATATFGVETGEVVTCVFAATKDGAIAVQIQTLPDGSSQSFDFTGNVRATIGDGDTASAPVSPGFYLVNQTVPAGWTLTDITCDDTASATPSTGNTTTGEIDFNVEPGETVTCVLTNTELSTIIVEKQTLPDGAVGDFTFTGDAAGTIADNGTIVVENLLPGTYTSTETPLSGFDLTDITCSDTASTNPSSGNTTTGQATFEVDPGETVTCVFTNTQRGAIFVRKQTLPGGSTRSFNFSGEVTGSVVDGGGIGRRGVVPGQYTVTEALSGGFDLSAITCDDSTSATPSTGDLGSRTATFNVDPGERVECVFTNTRRGTITIETVTDPANEPGSFQYDGAIAVTQSHGDSTTSPTLAPGQYLVAQISAAAGLPLSDVTCNDTNSTGDVGTATATIQLDPGENLTCTFTNSVPGSITIQKNSIAGTGVFSFAGDLGPFTLDTTGDGTEATTFTNVPVGTIVVTEDDPSPAVLTGLTCNDGGSATPSNTSTTTRTATIELDAAESVTCIFTNAYNLPPSIAGGATAAVNADENQTAVTDVDATDSIDAEGSGLTYSLTTDGGGGVDNGLFTIDPNTGVLTFLNAPDFENPADDDTDGVYEAQVTVADSGGLTDVQDISVTVLDVNDPAVVTTSPGSTAFTEGGFPVRIDPDITVTDQDAGPQNTFSATVTITNLRDGADEVLTCGFCGGGIFVTDSYSQGVLTIAGTASATDYHTLLRSVAYENTSQTPDETDRVIEFVVNQGVLSDPATKTVTVTAVNSPPIAGNDTYANVPVNVVLDAGVGEAGVDVDNASGVLVNDTDPEGNSFSVSGIGGCADTVAPFVCASTGGGTVTMNADGTFTYVSAPGSNAPSDSFTYTTIDNGSPAATSSAATVTINLTPQTIWFLNPSAPAGGNGTSKSPFNTVASFNSTAADQDRDVIYLHEGAYTGNFFLAAEQQLIGAGVGLTSGGLTIPPGTAPTLTATAGNAVDLDINNTVRGFDIGDTPGGTAIVGSFVGTPTINTVNVTGLGGILDLNGAITSNIALGTQSSVNAPQSAIRLVNTIGTYSGGAPTITTPTQHGIEISSGDVAATFTGGTIVHASTDTTFDAIRIVGDAGSSTIATAVTKTSGGNPIEINGGSGTVTFTGTIIGTGSQGILVTNSATVAFNGAVDITDSTNRGVDISGTGTVGFADLDVNNATSNQAAIVSTGGTVNITTGTANGGSGTAVNMSNTTLGVTLQRVDSVGGSTAGIILDTTTGSFTVAGSSATGCQSDAANCSGGSITDKVGGANGVDGVTLANATNVALNDMNISNNTRNGIFGTSVNGFVLNDVRLNGNTDQFSPREQGLRLIDLTGDADHPTTITDTTISNSFEHNAVVQNSGGVLTDLVVTGSTFGPNPSASGADGLYFESSAGTHTLTITSSVFTDNKSDGLQVNPNGGTVTVAVSGSRFTSSSQVIDQGQGQGINLTASGSSNLYFDVVNNPVFQDHRLHAIAVFSASPGIMEGTISGNTIGTAGDQSSGSLTGSGIATVNDGFGGTLTVAVTNNTIREIGDGLFAGGQGLRIFSQTGVNTVNATVTGNSFDQVRDGRVLDASVTAGGTMCTNISGNSFTNVFQDPRLRQASGTHNNTQASEAALEAANGGQNFDLAGTITFGAAACPTP